MLTPIDRQTAKSWYRHRVEPHVAKLQGRLLRATGPRIAIIGTCQSFSIAHAMKLLQPTATVDHFPVIPRSHVPLKIFAQTLATYDFVMSHAFPQGFIPGGGSDELRGLLKKTTLLPVITFAAFHPDCISVGEDDIHAPIFGPLGLYHSALALFAFRAGLSEQEAAALFNQNVFEAVGYFDFWNEATAALLGSCKQDHGLDLSPEFNSWSRRGVFMYSNNHPKPFVIFDLAKKLLASVGLPASDLDYETYIVDDFIQYPVFPVYPPIGAHFGCRGSYTFKITPMNSRGHVGDYLLLPQFIKASYEKYGKCDSARLTNHRVETWLADAAATDLIVSLGRKNLRMGLLPER
ncbi:MAG: WcbI family polysaccharide biosynthesis putative acetyltransferase [Methylocystis sp.]